MQSSRLLTSAVLSRQRTRLKLAGCPNSLATLASSQILGGSKGFHNGPRLRIGRHVKEALANREPIVALESTVITHGMPEPENLRMALSLESEVRNIKFGHHYHEQAPNSTAVDDNEADNSISLATSSKAKSGSFEKVAAQFNGSASVTPATIGIIRGQLVVGLNEEELAYLADIKRSRPIKASRRDLPIAMGLKLSGGTTVAATMAIACSLQHITHDFSSNLPHGIPLNGRSNNNGKLSGYRGSHSGIKVFATGGIGGVHVGGHDSMDISADLFEFSRSPIGVVSAGFKSFLDTRRSLEYLETVGCTVMSLDDGEEEDAGQAFFPGFLTRNNSQNVKSPCCVKSIDEAAQILFYSLQADHLPLSQSLSSSMSLSQSLMGSPLADRRATLLAVPIPKLFSLDHDQQLEHAMREATSSIESRCDLLGKEKTPLILEALNRITSGKSLQANKELLRNNARIGAHLAFKYSQLVNRAGAILAPETEAPATDSGDLLLTKPRIAPMRHLSPWLLCPVRVVEVPSGIVGTHNGNKPQERPTSDIKESIEARVVVVGGIIVDMHVSTELDDKFKNRAPLSGVTFKGEPHLSVGGVGGNLAQALEYLGHKPNFLSTLGRDELGSFARAHLESCGLEQDRLVLANEKPEAQAEGDRAGPLSTCFSLVLSDSISGLCEFVIANLDAISAIDETTLDLNEKMLSEAQLVAMDANLSAQTLVKLLKLCHSNRVAAFLEPTDKLAIPRLASCLKQLQHDRVSLLCMSPNLVEFRALMEQFEGSSPPFSDPKREEPDYDSSLQLIERDARKLLQFHLPYLTCLLVTLDARGCLVALRVPQATCGVSDELRLAPGNSSLLPADQVSRLKLLKLGSDGEGDVILTSHFPVPEPLVKKPISGSGAGDSFAGGFISGLLQDLQLGQCLELAFKAAKFALESKSTISPQLRQLALGSDRRV